MNRLKELRKKNKTTQKELANLLGVSEMTISRWENSESVSLKHDKVQSLAEYFGVTVEYLLGYEEYYNIENEALDSYKKIKKLLLTNPDLKKIILEYNESKRKQGKWDLSLVTTTDTIPLIEQNIIDLILK